MPPRLLGALSRTPLPAHASGQSGLRERRHQYGFTSVDSNASVFEVLGVLYVSFGEPRFSDRQLAEQATAEGHAAAWAAAFRRRGADAAAHVRGRFCMLSVDATQLELTVITDRFATWPVCYALTADGVAFSDRADSVPVPTKTISHQAIYDYLFAHVIPSPTTIFHEVERLPAAHALTWTPTKLERRPYWQPSFAPDARQDLGSAKRRFVTLIREAVEAEAAPPKPVAAFLSGGTDSSTVAGMLCRVLGKPAPTYSIGFDASGYDEMHYARVAARHFGTDHHEYYVVPDDVVAGAQRIATHYDQPFGNSSAVAALCCASKAKADGVTRMLAGDGGDELFGGNSRYAKQRVFDWYQNVPRVVRDAVLGPLARQPVAPRLPVVKKACSYIAQASVPLPDRLEQYNLLERIGTATALTADYLASVHPEQPLARQREYWAAVDAKSQLDRMLALDWKYTLADNDLPKVVGTTALAGVDVAFPLLSDDLVDFSLTLPTDWKLKGLTLRWFFKEALRDFLPDEILTKKKHGFGLPYGLWACTHARLKELTHDTLQTFKKRKIVKPQFVDTLLGEQLPAYPNYYGEMVWILLMLELWLQRQAPSFSA